MVVWAKQVVRHVEVRPHGGTSPMARRWVGCRVVTVRPLAQSHSNSAAFPPGARLSSDATDSATTTGAPSTPDAHSPPPVVSAVGLGKRFKLYSNPWHRAAEWLSFGSTKKHTEFWAVRGVSFSIGRGECVGVLGPNGSGKSTLLKMLSGALHPTEGTFDVRGRVLSLLELGTGLNHELTGRQNVLQGAELLGFPPRYGAEKIADIETFAELGPFFDRPIKHYSSGMLVRLAFSMFACFEPDVFVVDEALSVGDVFFQQKCVRRIEQMLAGGVTMLFVSHDMQLVQRLCHRAILLNKGAVVFTGAPDECVARYFSLVGQTMRCAPSNSESSAAGAPLRHSQHFDDLRARVIASDILPTARSRHGEGMLKMVAATIEDATGKSSAIMKQGDVATLRVLLRADDAFARPTCGIHLYDRLGNLVFAAGTAQLRSPLPPMIATDERLVTLRLTLDVQPGEYTLAIGCSEAPPPGLDIGVLQDQAEGLGPIAVHPTGESPARFYGIARLPMEITVE
jgi:lipopolysaccharide transport system ATP-binding protein